MKNWEITRSRILAAPVPPNTESYTAIPHSVFLEEIQEELTRNNYIITSERHLSSIDSAVITGSLTVQKPNQKLDVISPAVYFTNSP